ncbi:MAG TPA: FmdB family zinc ribbon protein [Pseudonocardiaceae bacterium]
MTIYAYRCPVCGPFELRLPMGGADGQQPCVHCGAAARRVFTAPHLARTPPQLATQLQREEASSDAPDVVEAVPPAAQRPQTTTAAHPAWASLPRP